MITLVSGLPRSGTSLMMQMLQAGGLPLLVDAHRPADKHNLRGYFEFEPVKSLGRDSSWMGMAEGRVLKVISLLLYDVPSDFHYKVLFMRRNLDEVLASQEEMLSGLGRDSDANREKMRMHFERHLLHLGQWLSKQPHIEVAYLDYRDVLQQPADAAGRIAAFLGQPLDCQRMAAAIDESLYRQRQER